MTYAELCDLLIEHSELEATNQTASFGTVYLKLARRTTLTEFPE